MCIYIYREREIYVCTHTCIPLFNKFKSGCVTCKHLLNTHNTELVHFNLNLSNGFEFDSWGWGWVCVVPKDTQQMAGTLEHLRQEST